MPKVFRAMKRELDGLPAVERAANALGVRPGPDIDVDPQGNVIVNDKGMSVSPSWQVMSVYRIPKRLGGKGSNNTFCFTMGSGAFQREDFATGLELVPDSRTHGVVRPKVIVSMAQFESNLAATRSSWVMDES